MGCSNNHFVASIATHSQTFRLVTAWLFFEIHSAALPLIIAIKCSSAHQTPRFKIILFGVIVAYQSVVPNSLCLIVAIFAHRQSSASHSILRGQLRLTARALRGKVLAALCTATVLARMAFVAPFPATSAQAAIPIMLRIITALSAYTAFADVPVMPFVASFPADAALASIPVVPFITHEMTA